MDSRFGYKKQPSPPKKFQISVEVDDYNEVNSFSLYYEHQILKVWDEYIQKKGLAFWQSPDKPIIKSLFSKDHTMSLVKQAGILVNEQGLYFNAKNQTVSVCGPVSFVMGTDNIGDLRKALKQVAKWNLGGGFDNQRNTIEDHKIVFPYNIEDCHWCLGVLKLRFIGQRLESEVKIFNPLPSLGGRQMKFSTQQAISETVQKLFPKYYATLTSKISYKAVTQQNDLCSCGVISAENGKDLFDGVFERRKITYARGASELRSQHLKEVNDQRFAQIQFTDEIVELPKFELDFMKKTMVNLTVDAFVKNHKLKLTLLSKFRELKKPPTVFPRRSAQIVRDIFQTNKAYFSGIKLKDGRNLYEALFKENKGDLEFQDETINILQVFTERIYQLMKGY